MGYLQDEYLHLHVKITVFDRIIKSILKKCGIATLVEMMVSDITLDSFLFPHQSNCIVFPKTTGKGPKYSFIHQLVDIIQDDNILRLS